MNNLNSNDTVNNLLVSLFDEIIELEECVLIKGEFKDISKNDMHIIDAIGSEETKNMSALAKKIKVTVGTLTIAINNLVKKGYVSRSRSKKDKRVVLISLSEKGERAFRQHKNFHERMVDSVIDGLDENQVGVLINTLKNVRSFIDTYGEEESKE